MLFFFRQKKSAFLIITSTFIITVLHLQPPLQCIHSVKRNSQIPQLQISWPTSRQPITLLYVGQVTGPLQTQVKSCLGLDINLAPFHPVALTHMLSQASTSP